jgi:heterodisulfide reductase subunit D
MIAAYQGLLACLDCGKCTGICPIAAAQGSLSPRRIVQKAIRHDVKAAAEAARACLTCALCDARCPADVPYVEAVKAIRAELGPNERPEIESHCGIFSTLAKLQTTPGLSPSRKDWLNDDLRTDPDSDTLLWVGCIPYYAAYFPDWAEDIAAMAQNAVRVLNRIGIVPAVRDEERCCGHDALWTGDVDTFERLAKLNLEWLEKTPAKRMVFLCASCALTFRKDIPERIGTLDKEMITLPELLAEHADELPTEEKAAKVTYHDPCRLGRHAGIYDEPRKVIESLPGVELEEMAHHREGALCCGGGTWQHCDAVTRRAQKRRLDEAVATGAEAMVTACPRCAIHLRCASEGANGAGNEPLGPPMLDLAGLVVDHLTPVVANGGDES